MELSEKIFTPWRQIAAVISEGVKTFYKWIDTGPGAGYQRFIRSHSPGGEEELLKDTDQSCRVYVTSCMNLFIPITFSADSRYVLSFVVATRVSNSELALLRSYENTESSQVLFDECKIWQACRATSDAPSFFDPVRIGSKGQVFIDGGTPSNNPIQLLNREADLIWPAKESFIISIGTGSAPGNSFKGNLKAIVDLMNAIITETERTADNFLSSHQIKTENDLLFRFNATHGLASIGLEEYKEIGSITDATETYLDRGDTVQRLTACVGRLSEIKSEGNVTSIISRD